MTATPTPLRELLAKAIADHIGHGMAEKCEGHADAVLAALSARDAAGAVGAIDETGEPYLYLSTDLPRGTLLYAEPTPAGEAGAVHLPADDPREDTPQQSLARFRQNIAAGEMVEFPAIDLATPPASAGAVGGEYHIEHIDTDHVRLTPIATPPAGVCQCEACAKNRQRDHSSPFYVEPLRERDPSKSSVEQGLFRKYDVRRTDGSDQPGGKHHGCDYFVLDVSHDRAAPTALAAYVEAIKGTHPELAADMVQRYDLATTPPASGEADGEARARKLYEPDEYEDAFKGRATPPAALDLHAACKALVGIVEGIEGFGRRWAANGERLKDTPEWVAFYVAVNRLAAVAPAGMVLVPREPTPAMQQAAEDCWEFWQNGNVTEEIWPAMLAAAPTPPATAGQE